MDFRFEQVARHLVQRAVTVSGSVVMLNIACVCLPIQDRKMRAKSFSCHACSTKSCLQSWVGFLEDFHRKNSSADLADQVLLEQLNLKWLCEGKPERWSDTTSTERRV